jgi:hypothetical protein
MSPYARWFRQQETTKVQCTDERKMKGQATATTATTSSSPAADAPHNSQQQQSGKELGFTDKTLHYVATTRSLTINLPIQCSRHH